MCIPDIIKNVTLKVFDLMSWTNKTNQIKWYQSCKCVCRLDPIICNKKQKWNKNKCRCEFLINKKCDNNFVWNPSNCKRKYKKKAALLVEECEEIIDNKTVSIKKKNKTPSTKKDNKTVSIKENLVSCKPFVASPIYLY